MQNEPSHLWYTLDALDALEKVVVCRKTMQPCSATVHTAIGPYTL